MFSCVRCARTFDIDSYRPIVISCNHIFCQPCLEELFSTNPFCIVCNEGISYTDMVSPSIFNPDSFIGRTALEPPPENLEASSGSMGSTLPSLEAGSDSLGSTLPNAGSCTEHNQLNHLRCMDHEHWICGDCGMLQHRQCRVLLVDEALHEMKQSASRYVSEQIETQSARINYVDELLEIMREKQNSLKREIKNFQLEQTEYKKQLKSNGKVIDGIQSGISKRKRFCFKLRNFETIVRSSTNNEQFSRTSKELESFLINESRAQEDFYTIPRECYRELTVEIIKEMCEIANVYAIRFHHKEAQFGKVEAKDGKIWVHRFELQKPEGELITLSFRELLLTFSGSLTLPKDAFIQLGDEESVFGNVVMATDRLDPRSLNFLLLCSGVKGISYKGNEVECCDVSFSRAIGTVALNREEAVVKGITNGGLYTAPIKRGFVAGVCVEKKKNILSAFTIWMEDTPSSEELLGKFGAVKEGLDVCEHAFKDAINGKKISFKNCGLII